MANDPLYDSYVNEAEAADVSGFRDEERVVVFHEGQAYEFARAARGSVGGGADDGEIVAPMPGKVAKVEVSAGQKVAKGQRLLTLEAMKIEYSIRAPFDGIVASSYFQAGDQVKAGDELVEFEALTEEVA